MKQCSQCKEWKDESEFYFIKPKNRYLAECRICESDRKKRYRTANKERLKQINREWQIANKEKCRAANERWKERNPGIAAQRMREWRENNKERHKQNQINRDIRIKNSVFENYGGYICACCGETEKLFLTIDHIHNNGNEHRKELFGRERSGRKFYEWLIANKFPEGYQVLCMNCNWGKSRNNGICPHKTSEGSSTITKVSTPKREEVRGSSKEDEDIVSSHE